MSVNKKNSGSSHSLPDVSEPAPQHNWGSPLSWVGMREMEMPIRLKLPSGELLGLAARADFGVNLTRQDARGIHMSRLYRFLAESLPTQELTFSKLAKLLGQALESHADLSTQAQLKLKFSLPLLRKALKSSGEGWRSYPVAFEVRGEKNKDPRLFMELELLYSSTCPASAALSRQILQQKALEHFKGDSISRAELEAYFANPESLAATPHAQRSVAKLKLELSASHFSEQKTPSSIAEDLIEKMEEALGTAVQSLVKREDEQEFAVRNAANLMFCEDAARRLNQALESETHLLGWKGEVSHIESLHPHDAVAEFSAKTLR